MRATTEKVLLFIMKSQSNHSAVAFLTGSVIVLAPAFAAERVVPTAICETDVAREFPLIAQDLGYLTLGTVFMALGLVTLLMTALRAASRDRTIFLFGAMSCVWGIRFLLYAPLVPMLLTGDPQALQPAARGFTYFSAAAAFHFALAYLGPGWRSTLRCVAYGSLAFAVIGSIMLLFNEDRDLLLPVFNSTILIGSAVVIVSLLHRELRRLTRERGLLGGFLASVACFGLENLRALGFVSLPFGVEWVGVLILYFTLGRVVTVRMFANERRLAAIDQELATARQIQSSLLPQRPPQTRGLLIAARHVPMTEVAGDVYDFVAIGEQRLGILIADVSGHGVPAALIASLAQGTFRTQAANLERPECVLTGMNRILVGQIEQQFVTASCTYIDTVAGILRYAAAGHPPLLIRRRDSESCLAVQQNGLILGQFPEATYAGVEVPLTPGDRLLLYTDGLFEATDLRAEIFGETGLRDFLTRHGDLPLERFADALLAAVGDWSLDQRGNSPQDDLTLIAIDVCRPGQQPPGN